VRLQPLGHLSGVNLGKERLRISVENAAANSADPLHTNSIGASSKRQLGREKKSRLK
jgi:hypothetical protein